MSLRAMKSLARTPLGGLKCIKMSIGDDKHIFAIHSSMNCLLGEMGAPLLCPEEDVCNIVYFGLGGSNPVHSCLDGGALVVRNIILDLFDQVDECLSGADHSVVGMGCLCLCALRLILCLMVSYRSLLE